MIPINNETYDAVYKDLPTTHFVLRKVPIYEYCGAKRFPGEGPGFCCRKGKVSIFSAPIPDELRHLFTSQNDSDAQYFRKIFGTSTHISRSPALGSLLIDVWPLLLVIQVPFVCIIPLHLI